VPDKEGYHQNPEYYCARAREYYYTHREQRKSYALEYQKRNKDLKRVWNMNDRRRVRRLLLELLGSKCAVCGTFEYIELDHLNARGTIDRNNRGNNWNMYRYYLKHPEEAKQKLQLLCKSHNLRKEFDNREHRNQSMPQMRQ
jgi:hypothetical protein